MIDLKLSEIAISINGDFCGEDKIINEEVYISNAEQDEKLSAIYQKWEEGIEKENNN